VRLTASRPREPIRQTAGKCADVNLVGAAAIGCIGQPFAIGRRGCS
jgi:hypothetical protein